jgi:hypothetical protein
VDSWRNVLEVALTGLTEAGAEWREAEDLLTVSGVWAHHLAGADFKLSASQDNAG